jgi:hypothetical protein
MTINVIFLSQQMMYVCQNISYLENAISLVHNYISFNFLSFNSSKTEVLIIGLPQQVAKLSTGYNIIILYIFLIMSHCLQLIRPIYLGVISDSTLYFSAISKFCIYHILGLIETSEKLSGSDW